MSSRGRQQIGYRLLAFLEHGEDTYVILLSLEFLTQVKLLSLQRHQPLPQLVGLLPAGKVIESIHPNVPAKQLVDWMRNLCGDDILQLVLAHVVNIERLPALGQDLLLLLPLRLFLSSSSVLTLC